MNIANPVSTFDRNAQLAEVLGWASLSPADTGGAITFEGEDPVIASVFRLGSIAAIGRMAPSAAAAAIWRRRTGRGQDLNVRLGDAVHELAPIITLNGFAPRALNTKYFATNGYVADFVPTRDGRRVTMSNVYPALRDAMAELIGLPSHRKADIAAAIGTWNGIELEEAAASAGAALAMVRTPAEWLASPQGRVLAQLPVVQIERIGDAPPEPLGPAARPLSGIRALGNARVLAGACMGMTFAEHGADVLNLWDPEGSELISSYLKAHLGMRPAFVANTDEGLRHTADLVRSADIVFENRRDGAASRRGLSFEECARLRPGIVHVSLRCYGHAGPWAGRGGFDPQALTATGYAATEGGSLDTPAKPPTEVVNDWVAAWFGAFGAMAALLRRAQEGGSWRVRVSLARTTMWWLNLPRAPVGAVVAAPVQPMRLAAETPLGTYHGTPCQVRFGETQPRFDTPLLPLGAARPEWLPRQAV